MNGDNPRKRDLGHHKVLDYYTKRTKKKGNKNDFVSWHYHPIPYTQNYHHSGIAYLNSSNIWEILSRKIIERNWFPSTYRPGFHTIRPDSNWFLEQWIPFDFSNQSTKNEGNQPDLIEGRRGGDVLPIHETSLQVLVTIKFQVVVIDGYLGVYRKQSENK